MMPQVPFKTQATLTERVRLCANCKYLADDSHCAKCACKDFTDKLFDMNKHCPIKRW